MAGPSPLVAAYAPPAPNPQAAEDQRLAQTYGVDASNGDQGLIGALTSSLEASWKVQRMGGREQELQAAEWERHRQIKAATGVDLPINRLMDVGVEAGDSPYKLDLSEGLGFGGVHRADYEAQVNALRAKRPDAMAAVPTYDGMRQQVAAKLSAVSQRAGEAASQHPVAAFVGGAAAQAADPVNLSVGLLTGGAGEGALASRILVGGAVQAGVWGGLSLAEAPAKIAEAQDVGGPEYGWSEALGEAGQAALGGALFHGAGVVGGALLKRGAKALGSRLSLSPEPEVRGAAQAAGAADRVDQAVGPLRDGGDYDAGAHALTQGAGPPAIEPARDVGDIGSDLFGQPPPPMALRERGKPREITPPASTPLPNAPNSSVFEATEYRGRPIYAGRFDPAEVGAAPDLFQYKSGGDAQGVTERLRGVQAWDQPSSGKALVWQDRDGGLFVADGHQRRGLALRMAEKGFEPRLDALLFREGDGWTSRDVRTIAALKNIREGQGSPLDAAKVFRDAPQALHDDSLPVSGDFIDQAKGLARLSPQAFGAVVNKVIPERYAAVIGQLAGERPDLHDGMVSLLKAGDPANLDEAHALVREALDDDWIKSEGEQGSLFGEGPAQSLAIGRAKVNAYVVGQLRKDARLFGNLVKNADAIEAGGNTLARDANEAHLAVNNTAMAIMSKLGLRVGEMGDAVTEAATRVAQGEKPGVAARGVLARLKSALATGEGVEGLRLAEIDPRPTSAPAEASLKPFEEPGGVGAKSQLVGKPEDAALEGETDGQATAAPSRAVAARAVDEAAARATSAEERATALADAEAAIREQHSRVKSAAEGNRKVIDTRGGDIQYHGARGPIERLTEGYANDANIYGGFETFYTTDAADVATGYFRKHPDAVLYRTRQTQPVRFFDMEESRSEEHWHAFFGVGPHDSGFVPEAIETASAEAGGQANLRQVMDEMRNLSRSYDISRGEVQEYFDCITSSLLSDGFGGMRHIGGLKTARAPHEVKIYLEPHNQIELQAVSVPREPLDEVTAQQSLALAGEVHEARLKAEDARRVADEAKAAHAAAKARLDAMPDEPSPAATRANEALPPGLFDDLADSGAEARALEHLRPCAPGE